MSYKGFENSVDEAQPIELFHIYDSNGNNYRYHTGYDDITYLGSTYSKGIVNRSEIVIGGEIDDDNSVMIELEKGNSLTNDFILNPIDAQVYINIYRQYGESYSKLWSGFLTFVKYNNTGKPECRFENLLTSTLRMGHRRRCSILCNYALYEGGCGVNQESYKAQGTLTNVSGLVLTSSTFADETDGYWVGGKIKIGNAWRLVKAHATNTVTVDRPFESSEIGDSYTIYAGCGHTPTICLNKYSNKVNFGGNEFLPVENPFEINIEL